MKKRWDVDSGRLAKCHSHMHEGCPHLPAFTCSSVCYMLERIFGNPFVFKRLIEYPSHGRDSDRPSRVHRAAAATNPGCTLPESLEISFWRQRVSTMIETYGRLETCMRSLKQHGACMRVVTNCACMFRDDHRSQQFLKHVASENQCPGSLAKCMRRRPSRTLGSIGSNRLAMTE